MIRRNRIIGLSLVFLLFFAALFGRLFYLQVCQHADFQKMSLQQIRRTIAVPAKRGNIYDRRGTLLAATVDSAMVYVDCLHLADPEQAAAQLAAALQMPRAEVAARLQNPNAYVLLKRRLSEQEAAALRRLKLKGVHLLHDQKRIYLREQLAANVLGFVDQDNQGRGGLEYFQEKYLQGIPGELIIEIDPSGRELHAGERLLKEPHDGDNITLTIDEFLQYIARKYLAAAVREERADGGSAIIMDVRSGQILAMVSLPDYDPNRYFAYPPENLRNNTMQTIYEPGSVFKLITVAAALDSGLASSNTTIINGNIFEISGQSIRESHPLKDPERPRMLKDIIIDSLNISAAKLALQLGKEKMYEYMDKFQLSSRTDIQLAGESAGVRSPLAQVQPLDLAVSGYGHGFGVTPLQMISAVNAIANDGKYVKPSIVLNISDNKGDLLRDFAKTVQTKQIIRPQTAWDIRLMMQECVQKGSGILAGLPGYSIGGKTGTSQKTNPNGRGYLPGSYVSSFAGVLPGNKPRLSILVIIDNPKKSYFGGQTAAPVFREIAREAARYLAIPEDI
ncbi:MAG: penicillin-binding protein 2 [Candidatus Margulisbacteria bacterium]|jgi:cell division protein FtsI/penicillin-binding protein 2|nr:penicillin-binding protein 2 [Candidatus Margulisiibacteriota bacterium]